MSDAIVAKNVLAKWKPLLENAQAGPVVKDPFKKAAIARILENQTTWNKQNTALLNESAPTNFSGGMPSTGTTNVRGWDPVLVAMLRRAAPLMIAFDVCGVQPMSMPTGLVFALRARYVDKTDGTAADMTDNVEALYNEADTDFSGIGTHAGSDPAVLNNASPGTYTAGTPMSTLQGESLGDGSQNWGEMGMTIEKIAVTAMTRGLKADYSTELAQDLRAVHGLDAETELTNILSQEILFEINRQVIRDLYVIAKKGAQTGVATAGTFDLDVDSNGRWSVEKFKGLMFQIEREANQIATDTRRGRGNVIICSQDVASALAMAGVLDYAPALQAATDLNVDGATATYAGILNGKYKVFIDPYFAPTGGTDNNFALIGYKGANAYEAGYFYCPYVPLEMYKAIDPATMQPKMAFKTRYGTVTNPYANVGGTPGAITANQNIFYRKIKISNIL